jgi:hypothetical protein
LWKNLLEFRFVVAEVLKKNLSAMAPIKSTVSTARTPLIALLVDRFLLKINITSHAWESYLG